MAGPLRRMALGGVAALVALLVLSWSAGLVDGESVVADDAPRAAWLTHRWVGERVDEPALERLVRRLRDARVTDVYVHVGPLDESGRVSRDRTPHARAFAEALHRRLRRLRVQAWLGQVEARGGGKLDLRNEEVRATTVRTAERFVRDGFDGIHYDIEPIWDGDRFFLALLRDTKRMLGRHDGVLSVAAEELPVFPGADRVIGAVVSRYHPWTAAYHREVARYADQIAVMTYDSAMPARHLYERFVARNTRVLASVLPTGTDLLIGVPSYEDWNAGHWPAEHLEAASRGLRRGLADLPPQRRARVGWALYAEWTTDDDEWRVLP